MAEGWLLAKCTDFVSQFEAADRDKDGFLNASEFNRCLGNLGAVRSLTMYLFRVFDRKNHGFVDVEDFVRTMMVMSYGSPQACMRHAFSMCDLDGDGKISLEDFKSFLTSLAGLFKNLQIEITDQNLNQFSIELYKNLDTSASGSSGSAFIDSSAFQNISQHMTQFIEKLSECLESSMPSTPQSSSATTTTATDSNLTPSNSRSQIQRISGRFSHPIKYVELDEERGHIEMTIRRPTDFQTFSAKLSFMWRWHVEQQTKPSHPAPNHIIELLRQSGDLKELSEKQRIGGQSVAFGHPSWSLVIALMTGIRSGISTLKSSTAPASPAEKLKQCFTQRVPFDDVPDAATLESYAPWLFDEIRQSFGVTRKAFVTSLGPSHVLVNLLLGRLVSLSESFSAGKSGAFFYYSHNRQYVIKTIPGSEKNKLMQMLPEYANYVQKHHSHTLLPRFFGCYKLKIPTRVVFFVVMANVLPSSVPFQERYDLKGSSVKRRTNYSKTSGLVMKDLDLERTIPILESQKQTLIDQLHSDTLWLSKQGIMDYSLLLGIFKTTDEINVTSLAGPLQGLHAQSAQQHELVGFGLIDSLTKYSLKKRLERWAKILFRCDQPEGISSIDPKRYQERFMRKMNEILQPEINVSVEVLNIPLEQGAD